MLFIQDIVYKQVLTNNASANKKAELTRGGAISGVT
jgi:hypothetical protein